TDDFMMRHVSPFCRAPGYMLPARKYSSRNKLNLVFYVVNIDLNDLLTRKTKPNQNKTPTTRIHSDKNIMVN
ncbi:hypothetical protein NQ311_25830, partial [Escherichia coli]|nr:hypothetical protein [Escherichia coli]MDW3458656.1 hypothetical protein [Escherichia coli]